jgi:hypothetical protein
VESVIVFKKNNGKTLWCNKVAELSQKYQWFSKYLITRKSYRYRKSVPDKAVPYVTNSSSVLEVL